MRCDVIPLLLTSDLYNQIDSWKKDGAGGIAKEVYISVQSPDSPLYPPKITVRLKRHFYNCFIIEK